MAGPAIVFGSLFALLLVGILLVAVNAVRRSNQGSATIAERGWTRLPDGADVVAGWQGWPFVRALEPGRARDIVVGHHQGVRFVSLRWTQRESEPGEGPVRNGKPERYSIVALAVEHDYPTLSVVRGRHRISRERQRPGTEEFETGNAQFDRRWQAVGDVQFGRAVLTAEVRRLMDDLDHAWAFQHGWVTRVLPWEFYAGENPMLEEFEGLAALLRAVPAEVWNRYGGAPDLGQLGHLGNR